MFMKSILPISVATLPLLGCAGSKPATQVTEPQTAESQATAPQVTAPQTAEKTEAPATATVTDGNLQAPEEVKPAETSPEAASRATATTCKIEQLDTQAARIVLAVPDSAIISFSFSRNENAVRGVMEFTIDDRLSDEYVKSECENALARDDFRNVACNNRTITGEMPLDELPATFGYAVIAAEFAKGCEKIQKTGDMEDLNVRKSKEKTPNGTTSQANPPIKQYTECNIQFASNLWTAKTEEGTIETYEFTDNAVKLTQDKTMDLYSPELCQIPLPVLSPLNPRCDGKILHIVKESAPTPLNGKTKEDFYTAIKSRCKTN